MNSLNEDLDDSALQCMTLVQKRKASASQNPKSSKQLKLTLFQKSLSCKSDEEKESAKSTKSQKCDLNESSSSYFGINKSANTCPLCLKVFENDSNYLTHMKQCAKKRKMTTQQLLGALELQKKQMEERRLYGLCPGVVPSSKKSVKNVNPLSKVDCDLALGLALSKSLETDSRPSSLSSEEPTQTLEDFGFSTSGKPNPVKKKCKTNKKSVLRGRTQEERQRIITEKAAVVLLDEEDGCTVTTKNVSQDYIIKNFEILKYHNKICHLWRLGENEETVTWYVDEIKEKIDLPNPKENEKNEVQEVEERKEKMASQENFERESLEEKQNNSSINEDYSEKKEPKEDQAIPLEVKKDQESVIEKDKENENKSLAEEERNDTQLTSTCEENFRREISKLKLPKSQFYEDWKNMINNEKFSDLTGKTKDSKNFYLHSLVFQARCPEVLEQDVKEIFQKYNLTTILIFLEYVYCGTVYSLSRTELENLLNLAISLNYLELINVLKDLETSLTESSEGMIPSSLTPEKEREVMLIESPKEADLTIVGGDVDMMVDEMVDLTQSSHSSSTIVDNINNNDSEDDSVEGKSYWSLLQMEKKREEIRRKEEEKENSEISMEMEKIETSIIKQNEMMKQILEEYKEDEINVLERQKIYELQIKESNAEERGKTSEECIVLSSDSETKQSKPSPQEAREIEYEIPQFDIYEDYNPYSPIQSQSFITGDVSFGHDTPEKKDERGKEMSPEYCSTPIAKSFRSETPPAASVSDAFGKTPTARKSLSFSRKRKKDLSANRIIRKSLGLKARNSSKLGRKVNKKEVAVDGKELVETITNSILDELSNSPRFQSSTPLSKERFIEMTPMGSRDIEFGETVTPSPNYSNMGESVIKEQLAKYGLKRSLCKSKAKKILQYIYEELHPLLNTKTGKLVKKVPSDTPKTRKKGKNKEKSTKRSEKAVNRKKTSKKPVETTKSSPKLNTTENSISSICSLDKSTDYDSEGSEYENLIEPLTQSVPSNVTDLPSTLNEYLSMNPEFHQKILLYEPIWLEELQKNLKETFNKHFKLSNLMDYLDQKCITFQSAAQKRNNEKRNEKRRNSPRKKKNSSR